MVKDLPAKAKDIRDAGSSTESGRSTRGGNGSHSNILAWRIPWTENPGGLQSTGLQRVECDQVHTHMISVLKLLMLNAMLHRL